MDHRFIISKKISSYDQEFDKRCKKGLSDINSHESIDVRSELLKKACKNY